MHLIFVHLGKAEARHLRPNIIRALKLFPNLEITVIYSEDLFTLNFRDLPIHLYKYQEIDDSDHSLSNLGHDTKFRNNFWRYSLERLYALSEWHVSHPNEKILHIESDILLMPNFPLATFGELERISWCAFNDTHDVASILFSPNPAETLWMIEGINNNISTDTRLTDMTALRRLRNEFPKRVSYLNSSENSDKFGGIIDAAPIGMWLCGRDPRNHYGVIRRFMKLPESDMDPSAVKYQILGDGVLKASFSDGTTKPILNLHVHSKQKILFGRAWRFWLSLYVFSSQFHFPNYWFSPTSFRELSRDFITRHGRKSIRRALRKLKIYR